MARATGLPPSEPRPWLGTQHAHFLGPHLSHTRHCCLPRAQRAGLWPLLTGSATGMDQGLGSGTQPELSVQHCRPPTATPLCRNEPRPASVSGIYSRPSVDKMLHSPPCTRPQAGLRGAELHLASGGGACQPVQPARTPG